MYPDDIQEVAQVVSCLPPTQASVESLFSTLHYVMFEHRSSMAEDRLNGILFVHTNWEWNIYRLPIFCAFENNCILIRSFVLFGLHFIVKRCCFLELHILNSSFFILCQCRALSKPGAVPKPDVDWKSPRLRSLSSRLSLKCINFTCGNHNLAPSLCFETLPFLFAPPLFHASNAGSGPVSGQKGCCGWVKRVWKSSGETDSPIHMTFPSPEFGTILD